MLAPAKAQYLHQPATFHFLLTHSKIAAGRFAVDPQRSMFVAVQTGSETERANAQRPCPIGPSSNQHGSDDGRNVLCSIGVPWSPWAPATWAPTYKK